MGSINPERVDGRGKTALTRLAARRLQEISDGKFVPEVREKASLCLLDFLGAAQSGIQSPLSKAVLKYTQIHAGKAEAYAIGADMAVCADTAAFNNAVLAHSAARDDMHLDSCSHMGGIVVSAVLALSQRDGWSGEQIIRGLVGGYEMGAVMGSSVRGSGTFNAHLRPSGLIGAFAATGAAIAAASLGEEAAVNALALAVNHACGFNEWAWSGGQELFIHNGTASRAGITAYDLARCGVEASETVLEGRDGVFIAINAGSGAEDLFKNWMASSPNGRGILEVRFKPSPTCNFTQTSSSLALKIARRHAVSEVEKITITTTSAAIAYPGCNNPGPLTPSMGKLSIQYGVCSALVFGKLDEESLRKTDDATVNLLMSNCHLLVNPDYDKSYRKGLQPAKVEVMLKDGTLYLESAPDVPWLNGEEVKARFLQEMALGIPVNKAKVLLDRCEMLGNVDIKGNLLHV